MLPLFIIVVIHLAFIRTTASQDCTLPSVLWGNWTTTNFGDISVSGGSILMSKAYTGIAVDVYDLQCRYISGSQYVLQSSASIIDTFGGNPPVYIWMCIELHRASDYSYYYYLNSEQENGFSGDRLKGFGDVSISVSDVCTVTLDPAEFHTMIKIGYETAAVTSVDCPDPLLGYFRYTYTVGGTTHCSNVNTAVVNSCNEWNRTHIVVNNTGCTQVSPFYSDNGVLGCIANVYDSTDQTYFVSLYNLDTTPTTQFTCIAVTKDENGTVLVSMNPTDCESGQNATVAPTTGATMVLTAECVPEITTPSSPSSSSSLVWLGILLPFLLITLIVTIVLFCVYWSLQRNERIRARRKEMLESANHPLGEVSIKLDAPATMDRFTANGYINTKHDIEKQKPTGHNPNVGPIGEPSLDLDFNGNTWEPASHRRYSDRRESAVTRRDIHVDEKSSRSNGVHQPLSPPESKNNRTIPRRTWFGKIKAQMKLKTIADRFKRPIKEQYVPPRPTLQRSNSNAKVQILKARNSSVKPSSFNIKRMNTTVQPGRLGSIDNLVTSRKPVKNMPQLHTFSMPTHTAVPRSHTVVIDPPPIQEEKPVKNVSKPNTFSVPRHTAVPRNHTVIIDTPPPPIQEDKKPVLTLEDLPDEYNFEQSPSSSVELQPSVEHHRAPSVLKRSYSQTRMLRPGASKKPWK